MSEQESPAETPEAARPPAGRLLSPTVLTIAIVIPVVLVVGMIIVGRMVVGGTGVSQDEPLAAAAVPQPDGETPECEEFVEVLPDEIGDAERVELTEPAPPATAGYRFEDGRPLVVRCGMLAPPTFDVASAIQIVNGVQWFHQEDPEESIPDSTWVTVDRAQHVTLTMPREADAAPIMDVSDLVSEHLAEVEPEPAPLE